MLSLDFICQHPDAVREALQKRGIAPDISEILHLADRRKQLFVARDAIYVQLKALKEQMRLQEGWQDVTGLNQQIKETTTDVRKKELEIDEIDTRLQILLLRLPNLPYMGIVNGEDAVEVRHWGEPPVFYTKPRPHWELGEALDLLDAGAGTKIAGSQFMTLKGAGARLERSLISFMLDVHTQEHGYIEVAPPQLVKRSVMLSAGQLPKFEDQAYLCTTDDLYLNPTAEVPLVGMHSDMTMNADDLPLRYVAWTTAFRREGGSSSRQNRGLLRLHQFNKVELFQCVSPQESYAVQEQMVQHAEHILQLLELPYRTVELPAKDLPFSAARTFDIEVWMPNLNGYVEVSSVSNCEAFQARRANMKYRSGRSTRVNYVHTLNGSGIAVGRTMAAILENCQQADGSIVVPKILRPYMGMSSLSHR
jgi:seryl-tRNA synthetase